MRIVALNPQPGNQKLFARLLDRAATVEQGRLPGERASRAAHPAVARRLAVAAALALARNELWGARLAWGRHDPRA